MADYDALYREYGLKGLVPHASQRGSGGYRFLADAIMGGAELFVALSKSTCGPFLSVREGAVCAYGFTDEQLASDFLLQQASNGYEIAIQKMGGRTLPDKMLCSGVQQLLVNSEATISVWDIVGHREGGRDFTEEFRQNTQVRAALYLAMQEQSLDESRNSYLALFFWLLRGATVYVPVIGQRVAEKEDPDLAILQTPMFRDVTGLCFMCAFLDEDDLNRFWTEGGEARQDMPQKLCYEMSYTELRSLFYSHPGARLAINPGAGALAIDHDMFRTLELRADMLWEQRKPSETGLDDDPVPDFLR